MNEDKTYWDYTLNELRKKNASKKAKEESEKIKDRMKAESLKISWKR